VIEIRRYVTRAGKDPIGDWLAGLKDRRARAKIAVRIARVATGNFGDSKRLSQNLYELRIDFGPGYRVYYAMLGRRCVLLLCGGDKGKQSADIERAHTYLKDYLERTDTE
jgi:putative addiction module killer protein